MKKGSVVFSVIVLLACMLYSITSRAEEIGIASEMRVVMPTVQENGDSPFDFKIDPQGLLYDTDAMMYGGGKVEKGATLLFRNRDGEYDYSHVSDKLVITNNGETSVVVTVSASIAENAGIQLVSGEGYSEDACALNLQLVDDKGNAVNLVNNTPVSITCSLGVNETYSFGLAGGCNPTGHWENISFHPQVDVIWQVAPAGQMNQIIDTTTYETETETETDEIETETLEIEAESSISTEMNEETVETDEQPSENTDESQDGM